MSATKITPYTRKETTLLEHCDKRHQNFAKILVTNSSWELVRTGRFDRNLSNHVGHLGVYGTSLLKQAMINAAWWFEPSEKYESQLGSLFPVYIERTRHVPNHQPEWQFQEPKYGHMA